MPYLLGNCITEVLDMSGRACGNLESCSMPNQLRIVDRYAEGGPCECINDPGQKGLGVLAEDSSEIVDAAIFQLIQYA